MIAVDTSALMAILLNEPEAPDCVDALASNHPILISAATVAEALIVAHGRGARTQMEGPDRRPRNRPPRPGGGAPRGGRLCPVGQGLSCRRAQFRGLLRLRARQ